MKLRPFVLQDIEKGIAANGGPLTGYLDPAVYAASAEDLVDDDGQNMADERRPSLAELSYSVLPKRERYASEADVVYVEDEHGRLELTLDASYVRLIVVVCEWMGYVWVDSCVQYGLCAFVVSRIL